MALVKITFDGSSVSAKQDADINYHLTGLKAEGIIKGLGDELAVSASNNYITFKSGYVQIYGRRIYVEAGSQVYVSLDSTKQGYIVIQVNLGSNSVSLMKLEGTSVPSLLRENLSETGTVYQMPIAKYSKTTTSLTLDASFKREYIETPLSVANSGYEKAVDYMDAKFGHYMKFTFATSNKCTIKLDNDQYATYQKTLFIVRLNIGLFIAVPGNGASGLSSQVVDYVYGGASHSIVLGISTSEKALAFTCNTTSHIVKAIYAYR